MARIRLVRGAKGGDGPEADRLRAAGHTVDAGPIEAAALKGLRAAPPDAVVIDLGHGFSTGRDVAIWLRQAKSTRGVPIVFLDGEAEKVERLRTQLPDATFAARSRLLSALRSALAHPPADPVRPASALAGYAGTPLPKKLGIKPGATLALLGAPDGFVERTLGPLPVGVTVRADLRKPPDLIVWFARSLAEVERRIETLSAKVGRDGLWIAWPKQASGVSTDLKEPDVRRIGLAHGLVDYKICAIDATWSGLKFARRSERK
jgi:CheY-like chemotaxis protein